MDSGDHRVVLDAVLVDVILDARRRQVHDLLPRALVPGQLDRRAGHLRDAVEHVGGVGRRDGSADRVLERERAGLALEVVVLALVVDVAAVGLAPSDGVAVGVEERLDPAVQERDDDQRRQHAGDPGDDSRNPAGLGVGPGLSWSVGMSRRVSAEGKEDGFSPQPISSSSKRTKNNKVKGEKGYRFDLPVLGGRDQHLLGALGEDEVDVDEERERNGERKHHERLDQRVVAAQHDRAQQQEEPRRDAPRDDRRSEPRDDDGHDTGEGRDLALRRGRPVDGLGAAPDEREAHDGGDDRVRRGDVEA